MACWCYYIVLLSNVPVLSSQMLARPTPPLGLEAVLPPVESESPLKWNLVTF
jgi:hypothetical protein